MRAVAVAASLVAHAGLVGAVVGFGLRSEPPQPVAVVPVTLVTLAPPAAPDPAPAVTQPQSQPNQSSPLKPPAVEEKAASPKEPASVEPVSEPEPALATVAAAAPILVPKEPVQPDAAARPIPPVPRHKPPVPVRTQSPAVQRASLTGEREVPAPPLTKAESIAALPAAETPIGAASPAPSAPRAGGAAMGNRPPAYPRQARRRGWEGKVVLRVAVSVAGTVETVSVRESSGHRLLDDAAREAVSSWRFDPAKLAGVPIAGTVDVPVTFRLTD